MITELEGQATLWRSRYAVLPPPSESLGVESEMCCHSGGGAPAEGGSGGSGGDGRLGGKAGSGLGGSGRGGGLAQRAAGALGSEGRRGRGGTAKQGGGTPKQPLAAGACSLQTGQAVDGMP